MPNRWPTGESLREDKLAMNFRSARTGHRRGTKGAKEKLQQ